MLILDKVQDVQDMARGAVLLGTGGGGDPYIGELFLRSQIRKGAHSKIIPCKDVADDAFVLSIAAVGAPTVAMEHLVSERTLLRLLAQAEAFYGRRVDALISPEIGGANSLIPLALGAISGTPVLDADGVGRAVPHIEMTTFSINGCSATPGIVMDDSGNVVMLETCDDRTAENVTRAIVGSLGALALGAFYPMTGKQAKAYSVQRTLTHALEIGRCIRVARSGVGDIFADLLACLSERDERHARIIFDGKVADVTHETRNGFHFGRISLVGLTNTHDECVVEIQNEFLVARINGRTAAIVPDLISILDRESGEPLTAEAVAYGQRVKVLAYAADPMLRRPESLEVLGPRLFGVDEDFRPIEQLAVEAGL